MQALKLNNGIEIPIVGSGTNTFGKVNDEYSAELSGETKEVEMAIANGYRHFDTAEIYRTEPVLAKGIKKSHLPREDFFITTKLNTKVEENTHAAGVRKALEASLVQLDTDYIDLFLIHFPWEGLEDTLAEVWAVLEEYYKKGVLKSIGVSNFEKDDLDLLLDIAEVKPVMNQIESHVGKWNDDLIKYCHDHDIAVTAYSPLSNHRGNKTLEEIGKKYDKTAAQVVLRYQIERDVVVIPKSHNDGRQKQNIDIFDFELSNEDKEKISEL